MMPNYRNFSAGLAAYLAFLFLLMVLVAGCSHRVAFDTPFGGVEAGVAVNPPR